MDYTSNQTAQGLASLGRGNDSMLVHMTPREVQGLQGLAMAHGGSLTINPNTGLPEAGFLDAILPMAGGALLSPFMGPLGAGLLIGGVTALTSGDLGKGIMAGLGGYGGADLGKIFTKMGTSGGIPVGAGAEVAKSGIAEALPMGSAQNISMFTPTGIAGTQTAALGGPQATFGALTANTPNVYSGAQGMADVAGTQNQILGGLGPQTATSGGGYSQMGELAKSLGGTGGTYSDMAKGAGDFISDPIGQYDAFKAAGGSGMKLATTGLGLASSLLPEPETPKGYVDPDTGKWRSDTGGLSLSDKFDSNLRLVAEGGAIESKNYVGGGSITSNAQAGTGLSGLYSNQDMQPTANISQDGYGIGRLDNLAAQRSTENAKLLGYAYGGLTSLKPGGYLDGAGDGMSDSIPATIEGKQPARLADGEFVVPADVVSHLGNGSSKAGSKRLYSMLDKVRQARTGNKKQGKQIKPEKYMPA
jgi:hypothetical protein